jgi:hypothetical protein
VLFLRLVLWQGYEPSPGNSDDAHNGFPIRLTGFTDVHSRLLSGLFFFLENYSHLFDHPPHHFNSKKIPVFIFWSSGRSKRSHKTVFLLNGRYLILYRVNLFFSPLSWNASGIVEDS